MDTRLNIQVIDVNTTHLANVLFKSGEKARSFKQPLEMIRTDMFRIEEALIRSQGRRGGGSWARLKPDTRNKKGMNKIIYTAGARSGYTELGNDTLVRSLTQREAPFHHSFVHTHTLDFGTDRPYAGVHQHGSIKRQIPARPLIRFTEYDQRRWMGWLHAHLMETFVADK